MDGGERLCGNQGQRGRPARTYQPNWQRLAELEAALSFIWCWRGVLEAE